MGKGRHNLMPSSEGGGGMTSKPSAPGGSAHHCNYFSHRRGKEREGEQRWKGARERKRDGELKGAVYTDEVVELLQLNFLISESTCSVQ